MQRQDRDPYEVLGLDADATSDEIKAAYRRLAMKHHPDKNPGDKASDWIFREVDRAYKTLQDISRGDRSSGRYGARRERQGYEKAEREGEESDAPAREQARRERQAQEDFRRAEQFVKESERRWARAEQERQKREQEHEDEEPCESTGNNSGSWSCLYCYCSSSSTTMRTWTSKAEWSFG